MALAVYTSLETHTHILSMYVRINRSYGYFNILNSNTSRTLDDL